MVDHYENSFLQVAQLINLKEKKMPLTNFDAVCGIHESGTNTYYFFKGSQYWKVQNDKIGNEYPRDISKWGHGTGKLKGPFDAVCGIHKSGKPNTYFFFRDRKYWKVESNSVPNGYPMDIIEWGFGKAWMKDVPGSKYLSELSIPGTHDTCALYDYEVLSQKTSTAQCQTLNLNSQLYRGVRCLDIRLNGDNLRVWHGDNDFFSVDQKISFDSVVNICKEFLKMFPNESILMSLKTEKGKNIGKAVYDKIQEDINLWYTKDTIPRLDEVRGKIVLLRRFSYQDALGIDLRNGWKNNDRHFQITAPNGTFHIQDCYLPSGNRSKAPKNKWEAVENMLKECQENSDVSNWYINFTSAAYPTDIGVYKECPNIKAISTYISPKLDSNLKNYNKCGTLMMDFVTTKAIKSIVAMN